MKVVGIIIVVLLVLGVISAILRSIRRAIRYFDTVFYIIWFVFLFILPAIFWATDEGDTGFAKALVVFFVSLILGGIFFWLGGLKDTTTVEHHGEEYKVECPDCHFNDVDIISQTEDYVEYRCPRCKKTHRGGFHKR